MSRCDLVRFQLGCAFFVPERSDLASTQTLARVIQVEKIFRLNWRNIRHNINPLVVEMDCDQNKALEKLRVRN